MSDVIKLSEKQLAVIGILREADGPMFASDIAAQDPVLFEKGEKSVNPLMTHLVAKYGLVEKADAAKEVQDKEGNTVTRTYKTYSLTELGREAVVEGR